MIIRLKGNPVDLEYINLGELIWLPELATGHQDLLSAAAVLPFSGLWKRILFLLPHMQFLESSPCESACFVWWFTTIAQTCVWLTSNDTTEHVIYFILTCDQARSFGIPAFPFQKLRTLFCLKQCYSLLPKMFGFFFSQSFLLFIVNTT